MRPTATLQALVVLALAAQVAYAQPNPFGWFTNAVTEKFFPAGLPTPNQPLQVIPLVLPTLAPNAYRGTYGHTTCQSNELIRPTSTQELSDAIKHLNEKAAKQGRPLKMRATRELFCTIPSFTCAVQPSDPKGVEMAAGPKAPLVVGIMMDKMKNVLKVDKENYTITVQGQITIKQFFDAITEAGMSSPRSALPWWNGLTLAGVFATASHGSGFNVTSTICHFTNEVTWVDAKGTIHKTPKDSDDFKGLCGGIGLLGAITELNLQLEPTTNTMLKTWFMKDDRNIAEDVAKMLKITPNLAVMWRPDIGRYTGHLQVDAPSWLPVNTDARHAVIPQFVPTSARILGPGLRSWQKDISNNKTMYFTGFDSYSCAAATLFAIGAPWANKPSPLSEQGLHIPFMYGVAPTNNLQSTECGENCAWLSKNMQATAMDVEFAIERSKLNDWIADIKALVAKDLKGLPGWGANFRCMLPGYYVMRFGKASDSHITMASNIKEPVYLQQQMLTSRNTPGVPSRYEWIQETYEQLTMCKHGGHPHLGKNWDRTFTNPKCPFVPRYGGGVEKLVALQDKHDPARVFEPELWARAVKGEKFFLKPRCQLDRSCYCEKDEHCADGFVCVPSIAHPQFNACRPRVMN